MESTERSKNLNINDNHINVIMEGRNSHHIQTDGINPGNSLSLSQSSITIPLNREDILAIYEEGPEAVVALVQTIFLKQAERIAELEERIKSLEDQKTKTAVIAVNHLQQTPLER